LDLYIIEQILKTKFPRLITKTISLEDIENYRNSIFNIGLIETKLLNNINLPLNYEHVFHLNFKKIESIVTLFYIIYFFFLIIKNLKKKDPS
jgi:hypothetical protein